jgi:hypothetical protein
MSTENTDLTGNVPRPVCMDTCVISAIAKGELSTSECEAMTQIEQLVESGQVTVWASTHVKDELEGIPQQFKQPHLDVYNSFKRIAAHPTTNWIDDDPSSVTFQQETVHPVFKTIQNIIPHEMDVRLLFQACVNNVTDFITLDEWSILRFRDELDAMVGIRTWTLSGFVDNHVERST